MADQGYRDRFDSKIASANSAISNVIVELREYVPGLRTVNTKRVISSISKALGRIDRTGARFPEYLLSDQGSSADFAIDLIGEIPGVASTNIEDLATRLLPQLVGVEDRLTKAVGLGASLIKEVKSQQVADLQTLSTSTEDILNRARGAAKNIQEREKRADITLANLEARVGGTDAAVASIQKNRSLVERLASGDARGKDSLERLARIARDKAKEIEQLTTDATASRDAAQARLMELERALKEVIEAKGHLEDTQAQADEILRGATQAGLAGAYKTERDRLSLEQKYFAGVFYFGSIAIIIYAALAIVPIFSQVLTASVDSTTRIGESALLLLVRIAVLAPAFWALVFTSKRHSKLETLQMDYAAKTATALAYSGYKDEMGEDPTLSSKLKDGLLVRFLEHPERLLNKEGVRETVGLGDNGITYQSTSMSPEKPASDTDERP